MIRFDKVVALLAAAAVVLLVGCEPNKSEPDDAPEFPPVEEDLQSDVIPLPNGPMGDIVVSNGGLLYAMADNASARRSLAAPNGGDFDPAIAPDGKLIYVTCETWKAVCSVTPSGERERLLRLTDIHADARSVEGLAVSPDGQKLAFDVDLPEGQSELFVYDLGTEAITRLTDDGVTDTEPSWLPGGGLVWSRGGQIVSATSLPTRRSRPTGTLTPTVLADGLAPDVSHDGTKIAYMAKESPGDPRSDYDIWTMNVDGSDQTKVTDNPDLTDSSPAWSPDDTRIAFVAKETPGGTEELFIIDEGGTNRRQLTNTDTNIDIRTIVAAERDPDWEDLAVTATLLPPPCAEEDPGCVHSVAEGDAGNTPLEFQVQLTEKPGTQLTVNFRIVAGSAVANADYVPPVAQTLTFGPNEDLKTISVAVVGDTIDEPDESFYVSLLPSTGVELGMERRQGSITDDDEAPSPSPSPTVGPTGPGAIAYQSGGGEVWVMKPDGTDQHKLTDGAAPDWKPDGSQIAFFDPASPDPDIFQIPPTGGAPTPVNGTSTFDGSPSWAPDGNGISWTNLGAGAPDIYKAEPPGGTPQPVVNTSAAEFNQDWDVLHDGTEVMAVVKDSAIILVNPDTGAQIGPVLVPASESANNPAISPDGTKIAYNSSLHGDPDIFVLDLISGGPAAHLTTSSAEDVAPTWSPDGTMLAFSTNRDGNFEIYTMNAATGASQTNITNTPVNEGEAAWGPAGTAAVIRAVTDAVDESSSDQEEPSSIAPSHGGRSSSSSSGTERGVRIAIPGLLLGSWFLGCRGKKLPPS